MSDNNLPVIMPTHVDDYQPPQGASDLNVPAGFNPPPAPVSTSQDTTNEPVNASDSNMSVRTLTPAEKLILSQTQGDDSIASTSKVPILMEDKPPMLNTTLSTNPVIAPVAPEQASTPTQEPAPAVDSDAILAPSSPVSPVVNTNNSPIDTNQSLEAQNIFDLLGVSDGKPEEKEAFLDELQDVIWEDFLGHDVDLLLTEAEMVKLNELKAKGNAPEVQEEILVFLEKLIPDLEDMMMDKAIELKEDMVMERIAGMREFHAQNVAALEKITQAEKHISEGHWADASQLLNSIK